MKFFYNVAYLIFALLYLPIFLVKIRQADHPKRLIQQRFGRLREDWLEELSVGNTLWIHAVSVGEVMAVEKFIQDFLKRNLTANIVLTTVTPTGQAIAKKIQSDRLYVAYFPFDFSVCMKSFFEKLKPAYFLLVETELWPNAILQAVEAGVPVGILNGRLSERSARRYCLFSFAFKKLFPKIDFVWCQTAQDAERFLKIGITKDRIQILGSMKYDELSMLIKESDRAKKIVEGWKKQGRKIFIAGSTHADEEKMITASFSRLKKKFPNWKLMLVPRHIERSERIKKQIQTFDLVVVTTRDRKDNLDADVLIVNELGVLKNLYEYTDLIFMGGSLVKKGGQNPIEALRFKKAIVYGPYVYNFLETYSRINELKGGILLQNQDDLDEALQNLMQNHEERNEIGQRGYASLLSLCGSTQKHLEAMEEKLYQPSESAKG